MGVGVLGTAVSQARMAGAHVLDAPEPDVEPTHVVLLPCAPGVQPPTPADLLHAQMQRWGVAAMHLLRTQLAAPAPALDWRCELR